MRCVILKAVTCALSMKTEDFLCFFSPTILIQVVTLFTEYFWRIRLLSFRDQTVSVLHFLTKQSIISQPTSMGWSLKERPWGHIRCQSLNAKSQQTVSDGCIKMMWLFMSGGLFECAAKPEQVCHMTSHFILTRGSHYSCRSSTSVSMCFVLTDCKYVNV